MPGYGHAVVRVALFWSQRHFETFVFDAMEGETLGGVETKRFQVAGNKFHRRNTPGADLVNEVEFVGEGGFRAPKPKTFQIA